MVSAPDDAVVDAVAVAIFGADYDWTVEEAVWAAKEQNEAWALDMARAVLAVPAVAEAFRKAALFDRVAEFVEVEVSKEGVPTCVLIEATS